MQVPVGTGAVLPTLSRCGSTSCAVSTNPASPEIEIQLNQRGDYSRYTLRLVELVDGEPAPLTGFDAPLSAVEFSFKVECPDESDCAPEGDCPPAGSLGVGGRFHDPEPKRERC